MHTWDEVCHLSQSSKSVPTGFLSRCMQYWLKNHWLGICSNTDSVRDYKASSCSSTHTNSISNATILSNSYVLLLSDLCACIQVKKMASQMKPYFFSDQFELDSKKRWGGAMLSIKCYCFVWKSLWKSHANSVKCCCFAWKPSWKSLYYHNYITCGLSLHRYRVYQLYDICCFSFST